MVYALRRLRRYLAVVVLLSTTGLWGSEDAVLTCASVETTLKTLYFKTSDQKKVEVAPYWLTYSQWVQEHCARDAEAGSTTNPLRIPLSEKDLLLYNSYLELISEGNVAELTYEILPRFSLEEHIVLWKNLTLLRIDVLKSLVSGSLTALLRGSNVLSRWAQDPSTLAQLDQVLDLKEQVRTRLLTSDDQNFLRASLYVDLSGNYSPEWCALSPANTALVVGGVSEQGGFIDVWDVLHATLTQHIETSEPVFRVQFHVGPEVLALTSKRVGLWNIVTKAFRTLVLDTEPSKKSKKVWGLNTSEDYQIVAFGIDSALYIADFSRKTCKKIVLAPLDAQKTEHARIYLVGKHFPVLVVTLDEGEILFFCSQTGAFLGKEKEHDQYVSHLYSKGTQFITISNEREVCHWDGSREAGKRFLKKDSMPQFAFYYAPVGHVVGIVEHKLVAFFEERSGEIFDSKPFLDTAYKPADAVIYDSEHFLAYGTEPCATPLPFRSDPYKLVMSSDCSFMICLSDRDAIIRVWHFFNKEIKSFLASSLTFEQALCLRLLTHYLRKQEERLSGVPIDMSFLRQPHVARFFMTLHPELRRMLYLSLPELRIALGESFYPPSDMHFVLDEQPVSSIAETSGAVSSSASSSSSATGISGNSTRRSDFMRAAMERGFSKHDVRSKDDSSKSRPMASMGSSLSSSDKVKRATISFMDVERINNDGDSPLRSVYITQHHDNHLSTSGKDRGDTSQAPEPFLVGVKKLTPRLGRVSGQEKGSKPDAQKDGGQLIGDSLSSAQKNSGVLETATTAGAESSAQTASGTNDHQSTLSRKVLLRSTSEHGVGQTDIEKRPRSISVVEPPTLSSSDKVKKIEKLPQESNAVEARTESSKSPRVSRGVSKSAATSRENSPRTGVSPRGSEGTLEGKSGAGSISSADVRVSPRAPLSSSQERPSQVRRGSPELALSKTKSVRHSYTSRGTLVNSQDKRSPLAQEQQTAEESAVETTSTSSDHQSLRTRRVRKNSLRGEETRAQEASEVPADRNQATSSTAVAAVVDQSKEENFFGEEPEVSTDDSSSESLSESSSASYSDGGTRRSLSRSSSTGMNSLDAVTAQELGIRGDLAYKIGKFDEAFKCMNALFNLKDNSPAVLRSSWYLGEMYMNGQGTVFNFGKAREMYLACSRQTTDASLQKASFARLGELYYFGLIDSESPYKEPAYVVRAQQLAEARAFFEKALEDVKILPLDVKARCLFLRGHLIVSESTTDDQKALGQAFMAQGLETTHTLIKTGETERVRVLGKLVQGFIYLGGGITVSRHEYGLASSVQASSTSQPGRAQLYMPEAAEKLYLEITNAKTAQKQFKAEAWYYLGKIYLTKKSTLKQARDAFKKACQDLGTSLPFYAKASLELGHIYAKGKGVSVNLVKAAEYYKQAMDQAYDRSVQAEAAYLSARLYEKGGKKIAKNSTTVFEHDSVAAKQIHWNDYRIKACLKLADSAYDRKDYITACLYYENVAKDSTDMRLLEPSWMRLAELYSDDESSLVHNREKAVGYYRLIDERGGSLPMKHMAIFKRGLLAFNAQNFDEAQQHLERATALNHNDSAKKKALELMVTVLKKKGVLKEK